MIGNGSRLRTGAAALVCACALAGTGAQAQRASARFALAANIVVPQMRAPVAEARPAVHITDIAVAVDVVGQMATTTIDVRLHNATSRRQEAQIVMPLPEGAVVRGFTFQGAAAEPTAQLLPHAEARELYNSIVARERDPALLEFVAYNALQSSVFPVEPGSDQQVRVIYEQLLRVNGNRVDYELPRSEAMGGDVPWHVTVTLRSRRGVSTVYSPSHATEVDRIGENAMRVATTGRTMQPGPFLLSWVFDEQALNASFFAYPDPARGGGFFLLLAGLPADIPAEAVPPREVTLVLDRSGSMSDGKMAQVRAAATQVLGGLKPGERFNIIAYNEGVDAFAAAPVATSEATYAAACDWLKGIQPRGGTNIRDALLEALHPAPGQGVLPLVIFLTDGLPTIGERSEFRLREEVQAANRYARRVFTFGVGTDVNAALLDRIAATSRATSTYVLPAEDVEVKVGDLFARLSGPVLAAPALHVLAADGTAAAGRVRDLLPRTLPDLFTGDQLLLLGQYVGEDPVRFDVSGEYLGATRRFAFTFDPGGATARNAFVPRLWAGRRIAHLVEVVRQSESNGATEADMQEVVDEIVALSREFGVLTEYTAFFAREGTDLGDAGAVARAVEQELRRRAQGVRHGAAAVNQGLNARAGTQQRVLSKSNAYWNEQLERVTVSTVQQINDRTFYKRGARWVDARIETVAPNRQPDHVLRVGSAEFLRLAERLAARNRQGAVALGGELMLEIDGEVYLCQ